MQKSNLFACFSVCSRICLETDTVVNQGISSNIVLTDHQVSISSKSLMRGPPVMNAQTIKERKKAILEKFGPYIPYVVIANLLSRGYKPSRKELDAFIKNAALFVVRNVDVKGKNWQPNSCKHQIDLLLNQYLSNLLLPKRPVSS